MSAVQVVTVHYVEMCVPGFGPDVGLTLGPSVPGVPGRPRGPCRPWGPAAPLSPGKPRSPWTVTKWQSDNQRHVWQSVVMVNTESQLTLGPVAPAAPASPGTPLKEKRWRDIFHIKTCMLEKSERTAALQEVLLLLSIKATLLPSQN